MPQPFLYRPLLLVAAALLSACAAFGRPKTPPPSAVQTSLAAEKTAEVGNVLKAAEAAYAAQDWTTAERNYLTLSRLQNDNGQVVFRLGNLYTRTGRLDEAVAAYREAVKREPGLTRAWHNLGIVELRLARQHFEEVTRVAGPDEEAAVARSRELGSGIDKLLSTGGN